MLDVPAAVSSEGVITLRKEEVPADAESVSFHDDFFTAREGDSGFFLILLKYLAVKRRYYVMLQMTRRYEAESMIKKLQKRSVGIQSSWTSQLVWLSDIPLADGEFIVRSGMLRRSKKL